MTLQYHTQRYTRLSATGGPPDVRRSPQLVFDGQVDADEAARFLLAREIKKLPEPVVTFG